MTVCVGIKVHDCIVFAADSAVSLVGQSGIENIYNHGPKVFNLHRELPIMAMTSGMGNFGPASISNLSKELRMRFQLKTAPTGVNPLSPDTYTIEEVADRAGRFFWEKYQEAYSVPDPSHSFSYWVGGYGANSDSGEIFKVEIQNGALKPIELMAMEEDIMRLVWGGQTSPMSRLVRGIDDDLLLEMVRVRLFETAPSLGQKLLQGITPLVNPSMPVQDAINLADFLVDMTKKYFSFLPGHNIVGGDTDIATVTKYEKFKWIKRKHYYPQSLNVREVEHE